MVVVDLGSPRIGPQNHGGTAGADSSWGALLIAEVLRPACVEGVLCLACEEEDPLPACVEGALRLVCAVGVLRPAGEVGAHGEGGEEEEIPDH